MKRIFLTLVLFAAVLIGAAQIVPVQAKTFRINYGAQSFSINLNSDSILMSSTEKVWFNTKFGSDTLLFGDGTYMTTAPTNGGLDTGYVKTLGDTIHGNYWFRGASDISIGENNDEVIINKDVVMVREFAGDCGFANFDSTYMTAGELHLSGCDPSGTQYGTVVMTSGGINSDYGVFTFNTTVEATTVIIGGIAINSYSGTMNDDVTKQLSNLIAGWGEVYVFDPVSGIVDEWAEFIFNSDGSVYLKSNSTDVVTTDTDGKFCIYDDGTGTTIKNRLGVARLVKYTIHI